MAAVKKLYDKLDDILMCSICLDLPKSKILQCASGHIFCTGCKDKVLFCPLCKNGFINTRNILAECIIECIEPMKVLIDNELKNMQATLLNQFKKEQKKKCPDKEVKTVSSQTSYSLCQRVVSSSTQTDKVTFASSVEKIKKKLPKKFAILYPCLIGSCLLELPYTDLIKHLAMCHKDTFCQVHQSSGKFMEKCVIETDILPKSTDFTFLISNMGLFFFYAFINNEGLVASVKVADIVPTGAFNYIVEIENEGRVLTQYNLVTSCRFNERSATASYVCKFGKEIHSMIMHKSIECTLTIQRNKPQVDGQ